MKLTLRRATGAVGAALGLWLVLTTWRNNTDGRIPVTFEAGPDALHAKLLVDGEFIGILEVGFTGGDQFEDGHVSRDWRIRLGRRTALLVTPKGDTLREEFVADESAIVCFKDKRVPFYRLKRSVDSVTTSR